MIHAKGLVLAIIITVTSAIYTQVHAETAGKSFTSGEFLEGEPSYQDGYIQISVVMTGVVATQANPAIAACIDEWYAPEAAAGRNEEIKAVMRDHPEHHPMGVILAVIQRSCGSFKSD